MLQAVTGSPQSTGRWDAVKARRTDDELNGRVGPISRSRFLRFEEARTW
jgi:hypothetical protein